MVSSFLRSKLWMIAISLLAIQLAPAAYADTAQCGKKGVWIQILGAGGDDLEDGQSGPSYLIWEDNKAKLLIEAGSGSAANFDKSGAELNTIDAFLLTHLSPDQSADLPVFLKALGSSDRDRPLTVLGPDGNQTDFPATTGFVDRLIGANGAYPHLADLLTARTPTGRLIRVRDIPAKGSREWSKYRQDGIKLTSRGVSHGGAPAIAWRIEIGAQVIVFSGNFSNDKNVMGKFAADADAFVTSHAVGDNARGRLSELFALPAELGKVAAQANVRMMILGHRSSRTRGRESQSRASIEEHYTGTTLFGNDLECWGL